VSRTCKRCGRSLLSLEAICVKLSAAPSAARLAAEQRAHPADRTAYAFGYLVSAVEDLILDLSCHVRGSRGQRLCVSRALWRRP
jgi:hypothetical protein